MVPPLRKRASKINVMKFKAILFGAALFASTGVFAQNTQISLGADVGIPVGDLGDVASLVVGPTLGVEFPVGTNLGITAQAGYQFVTTVDDAGIVFENRSILLKKFTMIPIQAGLKYYFVEQQLGFYGHAQVGIHMIAREFDPLTIEVPGFDDIQIAAREVSSTNFSWALGVGYQLENIDVSVRYNAMGPHDLEPNTVDIAGTELSYSYRSPAYSYVGIRLAYLFNVGGGA
jgi:hypothetical protein